MLLYYTSTLVSIRVRLVRAHVRSSKTYTCITHLDKSIELVTSEDFKIILKKDRFTVQCYSQVLF